MPCSSRRIFVLLLVTALAATPAWAQPSTDSLQFLRPADLIARLWSLLAQPWNKNGCELDPNGTTKNGCEVDPNGRDRATTKNGCEVDPSGRYSATAKNGCEFDPNGGRQATTKNGCELDPSGRCLAQPSCARLDKFSSPPAP